MVSLATTLSTQGEVMKSVLISIQPKWVEKICNEIYKRADGTSVYEKEIEIRKTRPTQDVPFRCLIYVTQPKKWFRFSSFGYSSDELLWLSKGKVEMNDGFKYWADDCDYKKLNGKVIGEFICDRIEDFSKWEYDYFALLRHIDLFAGTKNDFQFLDNYLKGQKKGYGWHISNLKIYDKPKELSEFKRPCNKEHDCGFCIRYDYMGHKCFDEITIPPQSWCYVEEV